MRIIERYLLKNFLFPLLFTLCSFILLYIIIDLFGHLDEILREKVPGQLLGRYYLYSVPLIFTQTIPFAILVSLLYCLGNLQKFNELIALHASGVSLFRIIRPFIFMGLAISIFVYIINETINPHAFIVTKNIKESFEKKPKQKEGILENVTLYGRKNRIVYARRFDIGKKILYDLIILEHDTNQILLSKITARQAIWQGSYWKLLGAIFYRLDPQGQIMGEPIFYAEKKFDLAERPNDFLRQEFVSEAMNSQELLDYINKFRGGSVKITQRLLVEFHYKKAFAFTSFVMSIIAISAALLKRYHGALVSVGVALGTGILFYGLNAVALALGKIGLLPAPVSAWIVPLIFTLLGIYLLRGRRY